MSTFEQIIHFLQAEMERPGNYGSFHLIYWGLVVLATVLLIWRFRDASDRAVRRILLVVWLTMVVLEVYKQLVFSMSVVDGVAVWDYQWYAFPFQFCSTPIFALPFAIFLPNGRVRDSFLIFFSGFSLFAGLAVMFYPNDVFIQTIGVNIQTMTHHGAQVVIGLFLVAHNRRRMQWRSLVGSLVVFYVFVAVAVGMNEGIYAMFVERGIDESFNMFYISRHFDCTLPILSVVYQKVPYPAFFLIYLIGFSLISLLFFSVEKWICRIATRERKPAPQRLSKKRQPDAGILIRLR